MADNIFLRGMERSDLPKIIDWLKSAQALQSYTFYYTYLPVERVKDLLIKNLSLAQINYSKKLFLVGEMPAQGIVSFHALEDIDWRNGTASFQNYFVAEACSTSVEKKVFKLLAEYVFDFLNLRKLYYYTKVKACFPKQKPEVVLRKHFFDGQKYQDLEVYGFTKKTFQEVFRVR